MEERQEQDAKIAPTEERLVVRVKHRGTIHALRVRDVVIDDDEAIELAFPAPAAPMVGSKADFTDPGFLVACAACDRDRLLGRIAVALIGDDPVTTELTEGKAGIVERVAAFRRRLKSWQAKAIVDQLRDPEVEVSEEEVQGAMRGIAPFGEKREAS